MAQRKRWGLTVRELAVLALVAKGYTDREIGQELGVAHQTARTYVSRILRKTHSKTRAAAAVKAQRAGLL